MTNLQVIPAVLIALLVAAVCAVALFLTINQVQGQFCPAGYVINESAEDCQDATNTSDTSTPNTVTTLFNTKQAAANTFSLAPTWGTLIGVGVLLFVVAAFAIGGFIAYQGSRRKGWL